MTPDSTPDPEAGPLTAADLDDPARIRDLDAMLTLDHLRMVIHPETMQRSAF